MDNKNNRLTCQAIKEWDLIGYLSAIGFEPAKVTRSGHWYFSPLRDENTPSFKVSRRLNRWYDHGIGTGGNLIDFCLLFYHCSVSELLQKLSGDFYFHQPIPVPVPIPVSVHPPVSPIREYKIVVIAISEITSTSLIKYLVQRNIRIDIASEYCYEVRFNTGPKSWYAIGFKNDSGGYELRSPFFKGGSTPKDITSVCKGCAIVAVFEGFFDFLSFLIYYQSTANKYDYLVLNSLSFFEKARPVMERYNEVWLYLDHDKAGQNCSKYALSLGSMYHDKSILYEGYKDLNEWLVKSRMDSS